MKTKEELNALKNEVEALNTKLAELSEDELKQVVGGEFVEPHDDGPGTWTSEANIFCVNEGVIIKKSDISSSSTYGAGIGGGAGYPSVNLPGTHDSGTHDITFDK